MPYVIPLLTAREPDMDSASQLPINIKRRVPAKDYTLLLA